MIAPDELIETKKRMLIAADAAYRVATSNGEYLELDAEQYELVYEGLVCLRQDCRRVLAELDVLRGMFAERMSSFFTEVVNAGNRDGSAGGGSVGGVPEASNLGSGEAPRDDDAAAGGGSDRSRPARKPRKRSKPRRHSADDGGVSVAVDGGAGAVEVDRVEGN